MEGAESTSDDDSVSLLDQNRQATGDTEKTPVTGDITAQHVSTETRTRVKIPSGTRLHRRTPNGETLLHLACRRKDLDQVRALIQAGINVNMEDYAGWTALHEASAVGEPFVVQDLLEAGAHANAASWDGTTPLHDAVSSGHFQVVKLLLQFGSSSTDRDLRGSSALDLAQKNIQGLLRPGDLGPNQLFSPGSRESGVGGGGGACGGGAKDSVVTQVLEQVLKEVERNQTQLRSNPQGAGGLPAALTQTLPVLTTVLIGQHLEMDHVAQRYRSVPALQRAILKKQLIVQLSRQRMLVQILQRQEQLAQAFEVSTKTRLGPGKEQLAQAFEVPMKTRPGPVQEQLAQALEVPRKTRTRPVQKQLAQAFEVPRKTRTRPVQKQLAQTFGQRHERNPPLKKGPVLARRGCPKLTRGPGPSLNPEKTPADPFIRLLNLRTVHLVQDEELVPNAVLDLIWEKLLES